MAKENTKSQTKPIKAKTFNEWIDMVFEHVNQRNRERYGINTPSTVKT